jgi:hypothetical protein
MGFKDLVRRLRTTVDELDASRLQDRFVGLDLTAVGEAQPRVPLRLCGEVKRVKIVPRSGVAALDLLISDGSGEIHALFTGRRTLGGVEPGRGIVIEGVAHRERNELVIMNPAYTLLPHG